MLESGPTSPAGVSVKQPGTLKHCALAISRRATLIGALIAITSISGCTNYASIMDRLETNSVFDEIRGERLVVHQRAARNDFGGSTRVTSIYLVEGSLEPVTEHWRVVMVRLTGDPEAAGDASGSSFGRSESSGGVVDGDHVSVQVSEVSPLSAEDLFVPKGYVAVQITVQDRS